VRHRHLPEALALFASALLVGGCAASPLSERFDAVSKEISSAKAQGAADYAPLDYTGAENALSLAKESETAALKASERAKEERERANLDLATLAKRQAEREEALDEAEKRRIAADGSLEVTKRRVAELRAKGVSERELTDSYGDKLALAELEANSARSSIKTIRAEIELIGIMKQEAQTRVKSASDGIAVAGQQLLTASALCDKAGASARMAEATAIAKRKAELEIR